MGNVYAGNSSHWKRPDEEITVFVSPAFRKGSHIFRYVEPGDLRQKPIQVIKDEGRIHLTSPALGTAVTAKIFMDAAPKSVSVNGKHVPGRFNRSEATLEIPLPRHVPIEVEIEPTPDSRSSYSYSSTGRGE